VLVILLAVTFARTWPLSKARVDLVYYSLAAVSAAILYLDNAEQRANVQRLVETREIEALRSVVRQQEAEVRRKLEISEQARGASEQASHDLPALNAEFTQANAAAGRALSRHHE